MNKTLQRFTGLTLCLLLISQSLPVSSNLAHASENPTKLRQEIEQLQSGMEDFLQDHAVAYSRIPNFKLQGELNGELDGSLRLHSPLGLTMLGTILGLATGGALTLGLPKISNDMARLLIGAAAGTALGTIAEQIRGGGNGKITGSIEGSITGEGWENLKSPRYFGLIVVDTDSYSRLRSAVRAYLGRSSFSPEPSAAKTTHACAAQYVNSVDSILRAARYATVEEARDFFAKLARHKQALRALKQSRFGLSAQQEAVIQDSIRAYEEWNDKHISVFHLNPQDMVVSRLRFTQAEVLDHYPEGRALFDFYYRKDAIAAEVLSSTHAALEERLKYDTFGRSGLKLARESEGQWGFKDRDGLGWQFFRLNIHRRYLVEIGVRSPDRSYGSRSLPARYWRHFRNPETDHMDFGPESVPELGLKLKKVVNTASTCNGSGLDYLLSTKKSVETFFEYGVPAGFLRDAKTTVHSN